MHSPAAEPSVPCHVRVYAEKRGDPIFNENHFEALLRWNKPEEPNGILTGYRIVCAFLEDGINNTACGSDGTIVSPQNTEFRLDNLIQNVTYYFQVD